MRIHALINYPFAGLGMIKTWAEKKGHTITTTSVYDGDRFSDIKDFDMMVILGGPMGAYEEEDYPWLREEKQVIENAIKSDKFVLGICLGAQMIASVLGARVYPHTHKEIGWWRITFHEHVKDISLFRDLPKEVIAYEFHGDTFDLPDGSVSLGESEGCRNQGFLYGDRVLGLQFHPEMTEGTLQYIAENQSHEIVEDKFAQRPHQFLGKANYIEKVKKFLFSLLDNIEEQMLEFDIIDEKNAQ